MIIITTIINIFTKCHHPTIRPKRLRLRCDFVDVDAAVDVFYGYYGDHGNDHVDGDDHGNPDDVDDDICPLGPDH